MPDPCRPRLKCIGLAMNGNGEAAAYEEPFIVDDAIVCADAASFGIVRFRRYPGNLPRCDIEDAMPLWISPQDAPLNSKHIILDLLQPVVDFGSDLNILSARSKENLEMLADLFSRARAGRLHVSAI